MFPTGTVRAARPPGNAAKRQTIVAKATRISAVGGREASKAPCKGVKARVACCPDRDMLSMQWKVPERERVYSFCFCKKNQKAAARTCKKLPVASFCASETAETGRIANGCEQGDHVSRSRLRPATLVQIAGRYGVLDRMTGVLHVTGFA